MNTQPFRWNIQKTEQLGTLPQEGENAYPEFLPDLRACVSRVLAFSGGADLFFVGRSPESLFDYLKGALHGTDVQDRLHWLNLSIRGWTVPELQKSFDLQALERQFWHLGLTPKQLVARANPVAFVDLVYGGGTFLSLYHLLLHWADRDGVPARTLLRKMRFVGIVESTKTSPNTWRWQQKVAWRPDAIPEVKNVSVPWRFWAYLGNTQPKVARSNPPACWKDEVQAPPREKAHLQALAFACKVYQTGRTRQEQHLLAREMATSPGMKQPAYRALVQQLKK